MMISGSFCTGIAGLDLAVDAVFGTTPAWFSEIDPDASTVLEHRFPNVPNIGSLIRDRYDDLPAVDVITAGYPCQPFSLAGRRKGTDDARHLWPHIADAVRVLRPRLVCLENVAGHLTLGFDRVLADLAALGFDAEWQVVAAGSVGAPHRRERLYILAAHPECVGREARSGLREGDQIEDRDGAASGRRAAADAASVGRDRGASSVESRMDRGDRVPTVRSEGVRQPHGSSRPPADTERNTVRVEPVAESRSSGAARAGLDREAPADADRQRREERRSPVPTGTQQPRAQLHRGATDWDRYAPAIARWERVVGRPAPTPTLDGRLNPRLPEWMMGFPDGWCTDIVKRTAALRLCGNAVVPQAAAAAFRMLADLMFCEAVA